MDLQRFVLLLQVFCWICIGAVALRGETFLFCYGRVLVTCCGGSEAARLSLCSGVTNVLKLLEKVFAPLSPCEILLRIEDSRVQKSSREALGVIVMALWLLLVEEIYFYNYRNFLSALEFLTWSIARRSRKKF
jgi:hypothetical protein